MDGIMSKTKKMFTATNVIVYGLSLFGLSIVATTQVITAFLPLLFAPMVCGLFGLLLYASQPTTTTDLSVGPTGSPTQE
ncbi:MAG: hypothetical protein QNL85_03925 [Euryarchaeota archaeon]|jgi:hypothetical protein|tara:strand:+ start:450 stop:686 length:237 start_codon:yes stop_codon:yes gene_type:complete